MSNFRKKVVYDSTLQYPWVISPSGEGLVYANNLDIRALDASIDNVEVVGVYPDGTNLMPSMDAVSRAGYVRLTDGTNEPAIEALSDDDHDIDGSYGQVTAAGLYARIDADTVKPLRMDASTHSIQTVTYEHHEIHSGSHYFIEGHTTLSTAATLYSNIITPDTAKVSHFTWRISSSGILNSNFYEIPTGGMAGGLRATIHANNRQETKNCWSGRHTTGASAATLVDTGQAWTVDALIGLQIFNQTDGSSGFITDNDATSVTATLAGGTDNDWDVADVYEINNSQLVITGGITVATSLGLLLSDAATGGTGWKADVGGEAQRTDEIVLRRNTTYLREFISGSDDNVISFKASWYEHTDKD